MESEREKKKTTHQQNGHLCPLPPLKHLAVKALGPLPHPTGSDPGLRLSGKGCGFRLTSHRLSGQLWPVGKAWSQTHVASSIASTTWEPGKSSPRPGLHQPPPSVPLASSSTCHAQVLQLVSGIIYSFTSQ